MEGLSAFAAVMGQAVRAVIGQGGAALARSRQARRAWYEDHVAPSYAALGDIHRDYMASFEEAARELRRHDNLRRVVAILKADRPLQAFERQELKTSLSELVRRRLSAKRSPKWEVLFFDYVDAVNGYLVAASPLGKGTWYSTFIEMFEEFLEQGKDPTTEEYPIAGGKHPSVRATEQLERTLNHMPERLEVVQKAHAALKAEILKG